MAGETVFPAYIRAEYVEGQGFRQFESEMNDSIRGVKQRFDAEFREINSIVTGALRRASEGAQGLDFGADAIRRSAAEARYKADALKITADAARALAKAEGDTSDQTMRLVAATRAAAIEAERGANAAANEASALLKLEQAANAAAAGNDQLAASYRGLYAEQIKAANAELAARAAQDRINSAASPGLTRGPATANGAGYGALAEAAAAEDRLISATQRRVAVERQLANSLDELRRAEAGAVNGSTMLQAAYRGTSEELGRVTKSARESAQAWLDLDQAQQQLTNAAGALRAQLDPMIPAQNRFNAAMDQADNLFREGAITAREYAAAQQLARNALQAEAQQIAGTTAAAERLNREQRRGTTATQAVTNSLGSQRFAMIQVGQQLQDVTVGLASGQRAAVVFAQQLPQLAFVMSDFGGKVGAVARFLAGPWGFAVFGAITALGLYASSGEEAAKASLDLSDAIDFQKMRTLDLISAIDELSRAQERQTRTSYENEQQTLRNANAALAAATAKRDEAIANLEANQVSIGFNPDSEMIAASESARYASEIGRLTAAQENARNLIRNAQIPIARRDAAAATDEAAAATLRYDRAEAALANRLRSGQINQEAYTDGLTRLMQTRDAEIAASRDRNRRRRGPSAETIANRAFRRNEFGDDTERRLADIAGQFSTVPPAIAQTERALRQVEDLRNDIMFKANPSERDGLIAELERVKDLVEGSIAERFAENLRLGQQDIEVQSLRTQGLEDQADALALQYDLMQQFGATNAEQLAIELNRRGVTADQYQRQLDQLATMQAMTREAQRMDRATTSVRVKLAAIDDLRGNIEQTIATLPSDFTGAIKGFFGNLQQQFRTLFAQNLTERLFGNTFAEIEAQISNSPRARADRAYAAQTDEVTRQMNDLEEAAKAAADALNGVGQDDIVVTGRRPGVSVAANDNSEVTTAIDVLNGSFSRLFENFLGRGSPLAKDLGSVLSSYLQNGPFGAALTGLGTLFSPESGIGKTLQGLSAAMPEIGAAIELNQAIGKALGTDQIKNGKLSTMLFGGPLTALFGSALRGSATIGGAGENFAVSLRGNSKKYKAAAGAGADSVIESLQAIADQLGGTIDASLGSVSIGVRKGKYRVDTTGSGKTKGNGVLDFGDDAEAAARAAAMDLITDGVITGLRAGAARLIQSGKDLDAQLQKALDFQSVFTRLKEYKDPVGAALDTLDKEFMRLQKIFAEAGASTEEYAQLEELYGIERAAAIKEAGERTVASLRGLFDELTVGNDARSLRSRLSMAQDKYNPLAQRVAAGDTSAYDDFAAAARELLDIQRQISGSGTDYFALLDQITALTKTRIDAETNIATISANRDSPFDANGNATNAANDNAAVTAAINAQTEALLAGLTGLGSDIIRAVYFSGGGGNGGGDGVIYQTAPF